MCLEPKVQLFLLLFGFFLFPLFNHLINFRDTSAAGGSGPGNSLNLFCRNSPLFQGCNNLFLFNKIAQTNQVPCHYFLDSKMVITIFLSSLGPSNSHKKIFCQVESPIFPSIIGIFSPGPTIPALRCESPLLS